MMRLCPSRQLLTTSWCRRLLSTNNTNSSSTNNLPPLVKPVVPRGGWSHPYVREWTSLEWGKGEISVADGGVRMQKPTVLVAKYALDDTVKTPYLDLSIRVQETGPGWTLGSANTC